MRRAALIRKMQLPEIFEAWRFFDDVQNRGCTALCRAIVHDRHAGSDSVDKRRTAALLPPMMRDDVDINFADLVYGTHQLHFLVLGEVAEVDNSQLAKGDEGPEGTYILGIVRGKRFRILAKWILLSSPGKRLFDQGGVCADDRGADPLNGENVAGLGDDVLVCSGCQQLLVSFPARDCVGVSALAVLAMIDEGPDRDPCRELGNAPNMIGMEMSDQHIVNLADACLPGDGGNAAGIAAFVAGPARVNQ